MGSRGRSLLQCSLVSLVEGHDFRTDYQALVILKRRFEAVPLLALTATATREVQRDIKEMLGLQLCETFRSSVDRKNLFYEVLAKESALPAACKQVHDWIEERFGADKENTCGIVYCFSRKETEQVCDEPNSSMAAATCVAGPPELLRTRLPTLVCAHAARP